LQEAWDHILEGPQQQHPTALGDFGASHLGASVRGLLQTKILPTPLGYTKMLYPDGHPSKY